MQHTGFSLPQLLLLWSTGLVAPWHVGSPWVRNQTHDPCMAGRLSTTEPPEKPLFGEFFLSQIVLSYSVIKHGWHTSALLIISPEFTVTRDTTVVRDHLPPPHLLLSLSGKRPQGGVGHREDPEEGARPSDWPGNPSSWGQDAPPQSLLAERPLLQKLPEAILCLTPPRRGRDPQTPSMPASQLPPILTKLFPVQGKPAGGANLREPKTPLPLPKISPRGKWQGTRPHTPGPGP